MVSFAVALTLPSKIGLNGNKTHVSFSTDAGIVGVVDLSTKEVLKMKTEHGNVSLSFPTSVSILLR